MVDWSGQEVGVVKTAQGYALINTLWLVPSNTLSELSCGMYVIERDYNEHDCSLSLG